MIFPPQTDLSEKNNVAAANLEVVTKLTALMQKYIAEGCSTPGEPQKNDVNISVDGTGGKKKKGKKADK